MKNPIDYRANFLGEFILEKDVNFEEFMKVIDVPYLMRKIALGLTPTMVVEYLGNEDLFKISCKLVKFYNYCIQFREGEEFEEKIFSGEVVKKIIKRDDSNRWIETQLTGKHAGLVYIREIKKDGSFKVTCQFKGVTGYRYFRKVTSSPRTSCSA